MSVYTDPVQAYIPVRDSGTLPAGYKSIAISHGATFTPDIVVISPTNDAAARAGLRTIAKGSSTFTVEAESIQDIDATFDYEVGKD